MARNIGNVVASINDLVSELGLEKIATSERSEKDTTHPAKQEGEGSNIQPATEGARSAENDSDVKDEVAGQSIAEATPADANKEPGKSNAANITTATMVGDDPKVEKGYVTSVTDPGTTSAAKLDSKTAEELSKCASDILVEVQAVEEGSVKDVVEAREKIASMLGAEEGKKDEVVDNSLQEYITGYVKSAALVGELTADMLDGMAAGMAEGEAEKEAEGEEMLEAGGGEMPPEGAMPEEGMPPAEDDGEDLGIDDEAAALAQAAAEIAAELGVSPEDVLDAAAAELEGGAGEGGVEEEMDEMPPEAAPAAPEGLPPEMMEVAANHQAILEEKAEKYDELIAKQAVYEAEDRQAEIVTTSVNSALSEFMKDRVEKK